MNHNPPVNPFEKGNKLAANAASGRHKKFNTPEELWQAAGTYFKHCITPVPTPVCRYNKVVEVPKMLPMSLKGLCLHIGICNLNYYKTIPEYDKIMERIANTIYVHNFNGAATGILNGRIIAGTLRRYK